MLEAVPIEDVIPRLVISGDKAAHAVFDVGDAAEAVVLQLKYKIGVFHPKQSTPIHRSSNRSWPLP